MSEIGPSDQKMKKIKEELRKREEDKPKEPVYLDHVRTSSGVRFRGYWKKV